MVDIEHRIKDSFDDYMKSAKQLGYADDSTATIARKLFAILDRKNKDVVQKS